MEFAEWLNIQEMSVNPNYMVDPFHIDQYQNSPPNIKEAVFLYCLISPGKKAVGQARSFWGFMSSAQRDETPFNFIRRIREEGTLTDHIRRWGLGTYTMIARSMSQAVDTIDVTDPKTMHSAIIAELPNVRYKTAKFIVNTLVPPDQRVQEDQDLAILDTHILKWIREELEKIPEEDVPPEFRGIKIPNQSPPIKKVYERIEALYNWLNQQHQMPDLEIWRSRIKPPPSDWKTRPVQRGLPGERKWFDPEGEELTRQKIGRKIQFLKGSEPYEWE